MKNPRWWVTLAVPAGFLSLTACDGMETGLAANVSGVCDYAPAAKPEGKLGLTKSQKRHATTIILKGAEKGMPKRAAEVAITASLQESTLRNNVVGDNGTAFGLFQMRPMYGWGSHAEVTDPDYASTKFYRVLKEVKGWENMDHAQAAQAVERSADGSLYYDNIKHAKRIVAIIAWEKCGGKPAKKKTPTPTEEPPMPTEPSMPTEPPMPTGI